MKTEVRIYVTSRPAEELAADLLVLLCHADERPLRGGVGRADWRLCGQLSKLLVEGVISGSVGERALLPGGGTLRTPRVLLLGLGEGASPAIQQIELALSGFTEVLRGLRLREAILDLPARWFSGADAHEIARLIGYRLAAGLQEPGEQELARRGGGAEPTPDADAAGGAEAAEGPGPYRIQIHVNRDNELRFRDALKREIPGIPNLELDSPSAQPDSGFSTRKISQNPSLSASSS